MNSPSPRKGEDKEDYPASGKGERRLCRRCNKRVEDSLVFNDASVILLVLVGHVYNCIHLIEGC